MILGLSLAAWFVVFVVLLVFVLQVCTKLPSDLVFLGGMGLLLVSGVIPAGAVLGSFSSSTVVLIGALFVVISGLVHTGFLQWVVRYCLGSPKTYHKAVIRLMFPVAALSSFLNNTAPPVNPLFAHFVRLEIRERKSCRRKRFDLVFVDRDDRCIIMTPCSHIHHQGKH